MNIEFDGWFLGSWITHVTENDYVCCFAFQLKTDEILIIAAQNDMLNENSFKQYPNSSLARFVFPNMQHVFKTNANVDLLKKCVPKLTNTLFKWN